MKVPAPPVIASVRPDAKTTALLVLDIVRQRCNMTDRPRCLATIAPVRGLLAEARKAGLPVIYSLIAGSAPADVIADIAPRAGEPVVTSGADKFLGTDLEKLLRDRGVKTVIVVGTAAEGAVLSTASEAAMRGFQVIVPVDGASSVQPYAEQYTVWHLMNAPGPVGHVTLTTTGQIHF